MSKRSRYLLIILCVVLFAIIAPATIFYSMGLSFDWSKGELTKTGILAFITDPKEPEAFLDNLPLKQPVSTLRYLKPKDYTLRFENPGYCSWQKRLPVNPGQVTWASPFDGKIYLLKALPETKTLSLGVSDFVYKNNSVLALKTLSLSIISTKNLAEKNYPISTPAESILALSGYSEYLLEFKTPTSTQFSVFDPNTSAIKKIPATFFGKTKILSEDGQYLALSENSLYSLNVQTGTKQLLDQAILDFSLISTDAYTLSKSQDKTFLYTFSLNNPKQKSTLAELPPFISARLFITSQKQIFVLGDGQLYQIGLEIKNLGSAEETGFDPSGPNLIYYSQGETDFFDFGSNQQRLISRSSEKTTNPMLASNLGYAIWQKGQKIEALELDSRDAQNSCDLYQGTDIKKIMPDETNQRLFILDGDELKMVEIR